MSMDKDRKAFALQIVLGKGKHKPKSDDDMESMGHDSMDDDDESDESMGEESAGKDLITAVESGDGKAVIEAMRACQSYL